MARADDASSDDIEFLDVGPERGFGGRGSLQLRRSRWTLFVGLCVLAAAAFVALTHRSAPSASPKPTTSTTHQAATSPPSLATLSTVATSPPAIVTVNAGHRLLGVAAGRRPLARI